MALPVVSTLKHSITIPSSGKEVKFRPFLVKEYKVLLQTLEMKDPGIFVNTICDLIEKCTDGEIDVNDLTQYDVDYVFLNIRAKSVGELVPVRYTCIKEVEKKKLVQNKISEGNERNEEPEFETVIEPCNTRIDVELNLGEIKIIQPPGYAKKRVVKITETNGIKLKTPSFRYFREIVNKKRDSNGNLDLEEFEADLIFGCIETIYDGDKLYLPGIDFTLEEFGNYLDQLPTKALSDINNFFEEIPYIALQTVIRCPVCGNTHAVEIRTLEDFFV